MPHTSALVAALMPLLLLASSSEPALPSCVCESAGGCLQAARAARAEDLERARGCYDRACDLGDAHACRELADTVPWDQPDVGAALSLAVDAATRGCARGLAQACGVLLGISMTHDRADLLPLVERACANGDAEVCYQLGSAWLSAAGGGADWPKAQRALERGCQLRLPDACHAIAERYAFGVPEAGVAAVPAKARARWWRACELGAVSSCEAGARFERKDELRPFPWSARRLLRRGCALGSAFGCAHANDLACERGDAEACAALEETSLGRCERRCRHWRGAVNDEGRSCAEWGTTCDDEVRRAEAPLQAALDEAARACVPATERVTAAVAELTVLVTGRARVDRVRLLPASDEAAERCLREQLSRARTYGVRAKARVRLRAHPRPR